MCKSSKYGEQQKGEQGGQKNTGRERKMTWRVRKGETDSLALQREDEEPSLPVSRRMESIILCDLQGCAMARQHAFPITTTATALHQ